ncbi:MAG: SDR family oxidoreductase [Tannerellaceae bacterium]|nr:SDR family oxidoreductase [Tannerellaceae bacterium]
MFKDKVAIVTGGGSGFGQAMSELYAQKGAKVVVADITDQAQTTVEAIKKAGGESIFVKTDVSNPQDCENLVKQAVQNYGRLDIAFNNAGIGGDTKPIGEYSIDAWNKIIAINLSGVFYGMHFQIPQMLKNGGGVIVNMSSVLGKVGLAGASGYVAAKHGVVGLTQNLALEYGQQNIRANCVGPGWVDTHLTHGMNQDKSEHDMMVNASPMKRLGKIDEIVDLVLWLSSDRASFCNGAYYPVDGGTLAG